MYRNKNLTYYFICLSLFLFSCTEQFIPEIKEDVSILVVDGKITNAKGPYEVRLFRTVNLNQPDSLNPEEGAIISIYDDKGNSDSFIEKSPGIYNNLTSDFRGVIGNAYWIEIQTSDGKKYESIPEVIPPEVLIESIYGEDTKMLQDNGTFLNGAGFYIDAKSPSNQSSYLRWSYQESWEWHSPFDEPKTPNQARICFPYDSSNNISVFDGSNLDNKEFKHLSTNFISLNEVKLNYNYFLNVSLYSISYDNYQFWKNIKQNIQANGGTYDILPSNTKGNICACENDADVIGYFEASAVNTKGKTFSIDNFQQEFNEFPVDCEDITLKLREEHYPDSHKFHTIKFYTEENIWVFIVRRNYCYDCNVKYSPTKPSFWP